MRAVIFDWDLTLWNSWSIHLRLMERTASDLGAATPTAAAVAAEFHRPFRRHLLWFFASHPDAADEADGILSTYLAHYYRSVVHRNYLYPGAASLLRALRQRGIRIGILSDKRTEFGQRELEQSGLAALVDCADFKTDTRPYKPAPDGLLRVLDALDTAPEAALYVGDAPQDIACARSAGAISAAALWATIDRDAILAQQPDYTAHRPHQIMAIVADASGDAGPNPWLRHLPWPWQPNADNPTDDEDSVTVTAAATLAAEPPDAAQRIWPLADQWQGRSRELALPPDTANPVAPLALRGR